MLVFFLGQGFEGVPHRLVNVEINHNYGTTLYAPSQDEEAKVHQKESHGTTCGGKC
jgi:hypothetical protein